MRVEQRRHALRSACFLLGLLGHLPCTSELETSVFSWLMCHYLWLKIVDTSGKVVVKRRVD